MTRIDKIANFAPLADLRRQVQSGEIDLKEVVQHYLNRAKELERLNVYLELFEEEVFEQAARVQEKIKEGKGGLLAGMVIALKDNICYEGHRLTASSKILDGFESLFSATVVERLLSEDAIIIGRTNCDEFAMGSSTENSAFGSTKNYFDEELVPGGSSGGSAVAVQAGLCRAALGSDTGGSVRQPAAFTGTYGFRPTYGHVSRYGLISYASSFDQIGPITRSAEDAALIMSVISGHDDRDATSSEQSINYNEPFEANKSLRIGLIKECLEHPGLDPEIKEKIDALVSKLKAAGHEITYLDFPYLEQVVPNYYVLTTAEASSNLSRYAGMLYGKRSEEAHDIESTIVKSRSEGFGPEVQRRIMLGTFVLSAGYYDAYYTKAQKVRRLIRDHTYRQLEEVDFILLPTAPHAPFKLGDKQDPIQMYLEDIFCVQASLAGIPAIACPLNPNSGSNPISLQVMGPAFSDHKMLKFVQYLTDYIV